MRIIAGQHRGRALQTPATSEIRPTSDKVRQALFNALNSRGVVVDAVVLDACCGTGAMGLEALSQGAELCIFMDVARASLALTQSNVSTLKEEKRSRYIQKDATKPGAKSSEIPEANLVFLDPPYHKGLVPLAFQALQTQGWLASDAIIVAETEKGADLSAITASVLFEKIYGETVVTVFSL